MYGVRNVVTILYKEFSNFVSGRLFAALVFLWRFFRSDHFLNVLPLRSKACHIFSPAKHNIAMSGGLRTAIVPPTKAAPKTTTKESQAAYIWSCGVMSKSEYEKPNIPVKEVR